MKKWRILWLCLLLGLTGCGAAGDDASQEAGPPVQMLPVETEPTREEHLQLYSEFDRYNTYDFFHGFTISEVDDGGALYYQLARDDADIRLLMDEEGNARLSAGDMTAVFTSSLMPAGGSTGIDWVDLTGDGAPEFIYVEYWGGTGFNPAHCRIFDGKTLEPLEVQDFTEDVKAAFSGIAEVWVCGIETYVENGELLARSVVMLPDAGTQQYFGEAIGRLDWDETAGQFALSAPMEAVLYPNEEKQ